MISSLRSTLFLASTLAVLGAGASALAAPPAQGISSPFDEEKKVEVHWIDIRGKLVKVNWPFRSEWVWVSQADFESARTNATRSVLTQDHARAADGAAAGANATPAELPVLRTWIKLPESVSIEEIRAEGAVIPIHPGKGPFSGKNVVAVDSLQRSSQVSFRLLRGGRAIIETSALIRATREGPARLIHKSCPEIGVSPYSSTIANAGKRGDYLYVALRCSLSSSELKVDLIGSPDSKWLAISSSGRTSFRGEKWLRYTFRRPKEEASDRRLLIRFAIGDPDGSDAERHFVFYTPKRLGRRYSLSVGAGVTSLLYTEKPYGYRIMEIAPTVKAAAAYQLVPGVFDIDASFYVNVAASPVSSSSPDLPSAKFYGVNARAGYRLPIDAGAMTWKFLAGYYFWGMNVKDRKYGISMTSGPQAFISGAYQAAGRRSASGYVKFAPVSTSPGKISLSSREIAVGGALQVNSPEARNPWMLTLDFSTMRVVSATTRNEARLHTSSLGISYRF